MIWVRISVDVEVDVDAVGHRPLVVVLHDQVLLEEAERLLRRGGGQTDDEGVEVLEHLAPQVVDRPMASSVMITSNVSIGIFGL